MNKMADEDDLEDKDAVAIYFVSDSNQATTCLGVLAVNKTRLRSEKLSHLRQAVIQKIKCLPEKFIFCTKEKWPIQLSQEPYYKTCMVHSEDNIIYIKRDYDKPKIGLKTNNGLALGFTFIELNETVSDLRTNVIEQIRTLSEVNKNVLFLDANGWPIKKDQESQVQVLEIVKESCVTLCSDIFYMENPFSSHIDLNLEYPKHEACETPPRKRLKKMGELTFCSSKDIVRSQSPPENGSFHSKQLLISYVRAEAADHALQLKTELSTLGFSVYLDVHEIKSGVDWQDSLNYAVSNCEIFVPLITPRYGETQWTNREIKLADVLGKYILPINFLETWPPRCLAIQFATTQYICWKTPSQISTDIADYGEHHAKDVRFWDVKYIKFVARSIASRLQKIVNADLERLPSLTRRVDLIRIKTLMKTFGGKLPNGIMAQISNDSSSSEIRNPSVVICVHPSQAVISLDIKAWLSAQGFDVWCSNEKGASIDESDKMPASQDSGHDNGHVQLELDSEYIKCFQEKADQADVVIIILCKHFALSRTCQQQVYYCEHRKQVIPLQVEDVCLPGWLSMLIGTNTFQHINQEGYKKLLLSQLQRCVDPTGKDSLQKEMNQAKSSSAINHIKKAINTACVYISGSTKFYHSHTEEICREIGRHLVGLDNIAVVTGGFYGVGETVSRSFYDEGKRLKKKRMVWHILPEKDPQDRRLQARQGTDGKFEIMPFGKTLFCGDNVNEREILVAKVFDICILIEGGPGAAHETEQFVWNDHVVIPVRCTGGAASGKFNVPHKIFQVPQGVSENDWSNLSKKNVSADVIGKSVTNIVDSLLKRLITEKDQMSSQSKTTTSVLASNTTNPSPQILSSNTKPSLTSMKTVLLG